MKMEKAQQFLHKNNLTYEHIDFEMEIVRFIEQMELGLKSDEGLPMVPTSHRPCLRYLMVRTADWLW